MTAGTSQGFFGAATRLASGAEPSPSSAKREFTSSCALSSALRQLIGDDRQADVRHDLPMLNRKRPRIGAAGIIQRDDGKARGM